MATQQDAVRRAAQLLTGGAAMSSSQLLAQANQLLKEIDSTTGNFNEQVKKSGSSKGTTANVVNLSKGHTCPVWWKPTSREAYVESLKTRSGVYGPQIIVGKERFCIPEGVTTVEDLSPLMRKKLLEPLFDTVLQAAKTGSGDNVSINLSCSVASKNKDKEACNKTADSACTYFVDGCYDTAAIASSLGLKQKAATGKQEAINAMLAKIGREGES